MTPDQIKLKRLRKAADAEMAIFDRLSARLREVLNNAEHSPRPSVVLNALLRGVPEDTIIERIQRSQPNAQNSDNT